MKKRAIGSLVLVSAMAMGSTGAFAADATKNADGKYDPEITITIGKQLDENTGRYGDGEDINKNPMTELTRESLGINMETTLLGGDASNYETKLRLALTSSDDLPDVFPVYSAQLAADMIESGMVKDITDDITNLMPDRLKEIYDQYPNTYSTVTKDGKIYGMAVSPHLTEGEVMIIRQDWLDNLGLEAPTTIDEFEEVIRAFTEDDPDGNGEKDTYGFTYEGDTIYNNGWCADPVTIFSVYTGKNLPGQWQEDEDGKLVYGSLDEGNKKALERLARWHANGWTFQEAAATGAWDAMTQFTEGKAGIFIGRPWCIDSVKDVTSVAPDAVVKAYPNILQENGEMTYQDAELNDGWLMFNKNFNNMEAFFEYYDWAYNPAFGTDGFKYGYLDGYDYQIQGDKVVFDSNLFHSCQVSQQYLRTPQDLVQWKHMQPLEMAKSQRQVQRFVQQLTLRVPIIVQKAMQLQMITRNIRIRVCLRQLQQQACPSTGSSFRQWRSRFTPTLSMETSLLMHLTSL